MGGALGGEVVRDWASKKLGGPLRRNSDAWLADVAD